MIFSQNFHEFFFFTPLFVSNLLSYFAEIHCCRAATFPARHNPSRAECDTWNESLWSSSQNTLCISVNTAEARNKQAGRGNRSGTGHRHWQKVKRFQESTHGGVCVLLKDSRLIIRANRRNAFPEPTVTHLTWPSVQNVNQNAGGDGNGHSRVMQLLPTKWEQTRPKLLSDRTSADFTSVPFFLSVSLGTINSDAPKKGVNGD